jgi:hypothetical protein
VHEVDGEESARDGDRMSSSSPRGMRPEVSGGVDGFFAGAFWLAKKEIGRTWVSYPMTGLFVLFLGFFVVPSVTGVFEFDGFGAGGRKMEDFYNAFFSDYLYLMICAFLGVNAISRDYTLLWRDPSSSRLLFLRTLPIPAGSLVGSRALSILFALVLGASAFFLPAYFFSGLGELGTSYLYFAGVWIGYGLLASGLCLLFELTVSGRVYTMIYFGVAASLMVVLAPLEWTLNLGLVGRTAELAQSSYGPLPAIFSILAGAAAFAFLSRLTVRRLQKRDLSA